MATEQTQLDVILRLKDEMSGKLAGLKAGLSGVGNQLASFGGYAVAGLSALGAGLGVVGGMALKSAADFEQTKIALTTMMGSAEDAGNLLQEIAKFAAETPFEMPELATTTKQLMAFGFSSNEAISGMKMLGDISSGLNVPIGDLAYLLGTLKAQGRAMTIDIRQFAMRGLPIYDTLAQVMGVAKEKVGDLVTEGKVGFPEVQKALELMTQEGGKFHGSMAAQATSLEGLYATLKDNVGFALREIVGINLKGEVREGSIFEMVRNSAVVFIGWLDANKEKIAAFFTNLINTIVAFGQQAYAILGPVFGAIMSFFSDLENRKAAIVAVLAVLTMAFTAWAVSIVTATAPLTLTILAIGTAVFFLAKAWNENWGGIQEKTRAVMEAINVFYTQYLVPFFNLLKKNSDNTTKWWKENWENVQWIFKGAWEAITAIFKIAWALFSGVFKISIDLMTGNWKKALEDIGSMFKSVWNGIKSFFVGIAESLMVIFATMINSFIDGLNRMIGKINKLPGVEIKDIGHISLGKIPQMAVGTNYVPNDMVAVVHEGEAIVPKKYNPSAGGIGGGITIQITGDNFFSNETDIEMLIEKIRFALSREQERANWGIS